MAIGVNIRKKMIPKTIGLTIVPSNSPNLYQSLFGKVSKFGLNREIQKRITERNRNKIPIIFKFDLKIK